MLLTKEENKGEQRQKKTEAGGAGGVDSGLVDYVARVSLAPRNGAADGIMGEAYSILENASCLGRPVD
ncbi:hypothetical protein SRHO_G00221310 [Serrasalmus rhombeus]